MNISRRAFFGPLLGIVLFPTALLTQKHKCLPDYQIGDVCNIKNSINQKSIGRIYDIKYIGNQKYYSLIGPTPTFDRWGFLESSEFLSKPTKDEYVEFIQSEYLRYMSNSVYFEVPFAEWKLGKDLTTKKYYKSLRKVRKV